MHDKIFAIDPGTTHSGYVIVEHDGREITRVLPRGKLLNGERLRQPRHIVYRMEEKEALCHSSRAKDANIVQALVDRYACGQPNHGKGIKASPGFFYGFSKDAWQAMAVAVTWLDRETRRSGQKGA